MLFKLLTPFTLVAVFVVRATSVFDFPNVIPRAEIPVGITVHEYNGTAAALGAAAAPKLETFGSLKEGSDCNGSPVCKYLVDEDNCIQAALRYQPNHYYCGYTSHFEYHCTAIYRCANGVYDHCLRGGYLQDLFLHMYIFQGCRKCGTYNIPDLKGCSVTFDYCFRCSAVGWINQE